MNCGNVLGPLLFLICVNDISTAIPGSKLKLFAYDTNLFMFGIDKSELCANCNILCNLLTDGLLQINYLCSGGGKGACAPGGTVQGAAFWRGENMEF